jgi:chorismate-pyruvate lyase
MPSTADNAPQVLPIAYPLDDFYAQQGLKLPVIGAVPGEEVPQPYRSLLVHDDDMTPTLEHFHGGRVHVTVMRRQQRGDYYFREVVLSRDSDNAPVEFGAIKIMLQLFPAGARQAILSEHTPLGRILAEHRIRHTSRPKAFLRVESDEFINSALQLQGPHVLYGRRNTLWNPEMKPLAEIVEILPPEPRD